MGPLDGMTSLVTGSGRGIGRAIALALAADGATVGVCARTGSEVEQVSEEIRGIGGTSIPIVADLSTEEGAVLVVETMLRECERVDILVNNAGGSRAIAPNKLTDSDWVDALSLNLLSAVRVTSRLAPAMAARGFGAIVNIASTSGREPGKYVAPYSVAKAALISYSKVLSDIYAPSGVRVNCVLPGLIHTSATSRNAAISARATGRSEEEVMGSMLEKNPIPLGRLGQPDDVAALVRLLVSPSAGFVTGATITVDGGAHRYA